MHDLSEGAVAALHARPRARLVVEVLQGGARDQAARTAAHEHLAVGTPWVFCLIVYVSCRILLIVVVLVFVIF